MSDVTREGKMDWMNLAREWVFLTNPNFPQSLIIYLAEFGKYVAEREKTQ